MGRWVKALANKPDGLSLLHRTHMVDHGGWREMTMGSCLLTSTRESWHMSPQTHAHACIHTSKTHTKITIFKNSHLLLPHLTDNGAH